MESILFETIKVYRAVGDWQHGAVQKNGILNLSLQIPSTTLHRLISDHGFGEYQIHIKALSAKVFPEQVAIEINGKHLVLKDPLNRSLYAPVHYFKKFNDLSMQWYRQDNRVQVCSIYSS
jgi:uncharacterized protein (DUF2252 family)